SVLCVRSVFFFQAEDGIRDRNVTGVQTCALPISRTSPIRRNDTACSTAYPLSTCRYSAATLWLSSPLVHKSTPRVSAVHLLLSEIGRASCRERVAISGVAVGVDREGDGMEGGVGK